MDEAERAQRRNERKKQLEDDLRKIEEEFERKAELRRKQREDRKKELEEQEEALRNRRASRLTRQTKAEITSTPESTSELAPTLVPVQDKEKESISPTAHLDETLAAAKALEEEMKRKRKEERKLEKEKQEAILEQQRKEKFERESASRASRKLRLERQSILRRSNSSLLSLPVHLVPAEAHKEEPAPESAHEREKRIENEKIKRQREVVEHSRVMKEVPLLEFECLSSTVLFNTPPSPFPIDLPLLKSHFHNEGKLELEAAKEILSRVSRLLRSEPNLLCVRAPVVVFGDVHGQFYDLLTMLASVGSPISNHHVFLGDYVDRGMFSTEVVFYLYCLKLCYPNSVTLLRGNHESRNITSNFNFKTECIYKYNEEVYNQIMESFDCLPLAALVTTENQTRFLCIHGGIGPNLKTIEQIDTIDRFQEPPQENNFCDILWADPGNEGEAAGMLPKKLEEWYEQEFKPNNVRGISYFTFYKPLLRFCTENNLASIIRGHEVQKFGSNEHRFRKRDREFPLMITLFSAPNYCDMYENRAAIMKITNDPTTPYDFLEYSWIDHPYCLPDFQNGFEFSLPYLIENVSKFCLNILAICTVEEDAETISINDQLKEEQRNRIRQKVRNIGKIMLTLQEKRMQKDESLHPAESLIKEAHLETRGTPIDAETDVFDKIVIADAENEKSPKQRRRSKTFLHKRN